MFIRAPISKARFCSNLVCHQQFFFFLSMGEATTEYIYHSPVSDITLPNVPLTDFIFRDVHRLEQLEVKIYTNLIL